MTRSTRKSFFSAAASPVRPLSVQQITMMTENKAAPILARMNEFEKNRFSNDWKRMLDLSNLVSEGAGGFQDFQILTQVFNLTAAGRVARDMRFDLSHGMAVESARFLGVAIQDEPYIRLLQAMTGDQKGHLLVAEMDRLGLSGRRLKGGFMSGEARERLRVYDETGFCGLFLEYPEQTIKVVSKPGFAGELKGMHMKKPFESLAVDLGRLIKRRALGTLRIPPLEMREIR